MNTIVEIEFPPFEFDSKARTLQRAGERITTGTVLPLQIFSVEQWRGEGARILAAASARFGAQRLIVRSSCKAEDLMSSSAAGHYVSVLNIEGEQALRAAIEEVIASYHGNAVDDEVFIQPMATGVRACGVAMTRDPDSGLPYYVINYTDDGDTTRVTSGGGRVQAFTSYEHSNAPWPPALAGLRRMLREMQQMTGLAALDVEFAITDAGPLLFQVRPMTALDGDRSDSGLHATLTAEEQRLTEFADTVRADVPGQHALFGIMPDWNPAEMIGVKPRPLAFSLYKELITDVNWSSARFRYGYRDMRHRQLMYQFCGTPYICIPRSIESFIPPSVPRATAKAIVATCCSYLAQNRHLHDKIEFHVVPTCYTPSLDRGSSGFEPVLSSLDAAQRARYILELKKITEHIISADGPFFNDLKLLPRIAQQTEELRDALDEGLHAFRQALSASKIVGEVFAGAARAAFVATAILKSVESLGRVRAGFTDMLVAGVYTIGKQVSDDFQTMTREGFLHRHGHIRPGTYDIRVRRYDEEPDGYFDWDAAVAMPGAVESHRTITRADLASLDLTFQESGLDVHADQFVRFAVTAIAAREKVKYMYAALVSEALRRLGTWGAARGLSAEDLSFLTLRNLENLSEQAHPDWAAAVDANRRAWAATRNVRAPEIICDPADLLCHVSSVSHPSFITRCVAESDVYVLSLGSTQTHDLRGKIVLIENADPGFDWIFTHPITGFITAYGGENSHMSIRSREFNIPAAVGVGDAMFRTLSGAGRILLDCAGQRIQVLR